MYDFFLYVICISLVGCICGMGFYILSVNRVMGLWLLKRIGVKVLVKL